MSEKKIFKMQTVVTDSNGKTVIEEQNAVCVKIGKHKKGSPIMLSGLFITDKDGILWKVDPEATSNLSCS